MSTYIWYVHKSNGLRPCVHFNSNHLIMPMWRIPPILCSPNFLWVKELFLKEFTLWMNFLKWAHAHEGYACKREYLLTCYHMSLAYAYLSKLSNFKLKFWLHISCSQWPCQWLSKSVPIDICCVHKSNYG